jgi:CBS domain-containing protein
MEVFNQKFSNLVVSSDKTIKETMALINNNRHGVAIIVQDDFHMLGVVSDGDIRRALVDGRSLLSEVGDVANINPVAAVSGKQTKDDLEELFKKHPEVTLIPIVDKGNKLVDVNIRKYNHGTQKESR